MNKFYKSSVPFFKVIFKQLRSHWILSGEIISIRQKLLFSFIVYLVFHHFGPEIHNLKSVHLVLCQRLLLIIL